MLCANYSALTAGVQPARLFANRAVVQFACVSAIITQVHFATRATFTAYMKSTSPFASRADMQSACSCAFATYMKFTGSIAITAGMFFACPVARCIGAGMFFTYGFAYTAYV